MNTFLKHALSVSVLCGGLFLSACKEDPALPDNEVTFESESLGIASNETELEIAVKLSRETSSAGSITVIVTATGLTYGNDYTTTPVESAGTITLPVTAGDLEVSFTVTKTPNVLLDGDEQLVFAIEAVDESLVIGEQATLTLSFAEIVSSSGTMEINGGGATYPNKVFIDLSANRQTAVARSTFDLGFYTGSDDFRVVLNASNGMMAYALDKTDLNAVTNADTAVLRSRLSLDAVFAAITSSTPPAWVNSAISWIDDPTGDLTKTAVASVSATATDNKVYIINRGAGPGTPATVLGWKKIRVLRNGSGYTLQHADINATSFSEIQIAKNNAFEFQYVSFNGGTIAVDPQRDRWDITWTGFTNSTNFGSGPVPYYFQDIILQNRVGVQTLQLMTSVITYEAFAEANLTGLDFGVQSQTKIGSAWRSGGGPGTSPAIRTDRFYVIKDADNNYYKLRFTALTTSGERGRPQFEYALVKKGN